MMKLLKSGIEMELSELDKIKGGLCTCGCNIQFNGSVMMVPGTEAGACSCGCACDKDTEAYDNNYMAVCAWEYQV